MKMTYRAEIDGLRAIAVLPVIFYHAGFSLFSGGFVGVDVFFVISGYLICSIILTDHALGKFTLVNFYERRIRRIFPALFIVIITSSVFAWFWLSPLQLKNYSLGVTSVSLFVSNIFFWRKNNYFNEGNEYNPIIHTWSLSVEEQFYLIFPVLFLFLLRFKDKLIVTLSVVIFCSLVCVQIFVLKYPSAVFYLLPFRGWELLLGALLALAKSSELIPLFFQEKRFNKEVLSLVGILLISSSFFLIDKNTIYPSVWTLLPTIGTLLILCSCDKNTLIGKILSHKYLVSIGLVSYSAYLWHQPIFSFARLRFFLDSEVFIFIVLIIVSFVLSFFSWKYIECPFRNKNNVSTNYIYSLGSVFSILLISSGLLVNSVDGIPGRYSDMQNKILSFSEYDKDESYKNGTCFLRQNQNYNEFSDICRKFPVTFDSKKVLIWGDSHAAALSYGVNETLEFNPVQLTASGCPPILGVMIIERPYCAEINNYVFRTIDELKPEYILLHANWSLYEELALSDSLGKTLTNILSVSPNTRIYLIGSIPQWNPDLPTLLFWEIEELKDNIYLENKSLNNLKIIDNEIQIHLDNLDYSFLAPYEFLCEKEFCLSTVSAGAEIEPIVWDYGHLTRSGSKYLAENILNYIKSVD